MYRPTVVLHLVVLLRLDRCETCVQLVVTNRSVQLRIVRARTRYSFFVITKEEMQIWLPLHTLGCVVVLHGIAEKIKRSVTNFHIVKVSATFHLFLSFVVR